MYIDTHAHLYYDNLKNQLAKVVERAEAAGVTQIICVGTDLPSSETSISIAEKYDAVFATVGVHPHDAKDAPDDYLHQLRDLTSHSKVVAVGEMGLDYFRDFSPRNMQKEVFQSQLALARELDLPAVIHNRDADEDILKILEEVSMKGLFSTVFPVIQRWPREQFPLGVFYLSQGMSLLVRTTPRPFSQPFPWIESCLKRTALL